MMRTNYFCRVVAGLVLLFCWAATTPNASAQLPDPNQGPGGPILVITSLSSTYGKFYAEILRTEGLNEFAVADIGTVTQTTLSSYDVVILAGPMTLTAGQVSTFSTWVNSGGNLIAMRPGPELDALLGLTSTAGTLSNGYMLVDTSTAAGSGIVNLPMQFHGLAKAYTLNGSAKLATIYSNPTTATSSPAVTLRNVGTNGGHAAAFAYDLATSVVYTRQGNPAWASQERDGFSPIRSDDKFFGDATGDPQADWVDLNTLVSVPQADEQQRLLANLIVQMNLARKPLPRFWYFPRGKKAVVVMTGDDHGNGGTAGRFDQQIAASPAGCNVANWECVRSTSYIFTEPQNLTNSQAASYAAQGFEIGLHINTDCSDFTPASLDTIYSQQIADFNNSYPSVPALSTERHHCIAWSDWATAAKTQLKYGMRLDASYYFWPPGWAQDRPGHFTGSAMPMRFADLDGTLINVYNVPTQMTDESGQSYPFTIDTLLTAALAGYYGVYTVNSHTDTGTNPVSDAVVPLAVARGVPIVSSAQMLRWLDARNSSSFSGLAWNGSVLTFTVAPGSGAIGLQSMVPRNSASGVLTGITGPGGAVTFTVDIIKGVQYASFPAVAGTYTVTYAADTTPPAVTSFSPGSGAVNVNQSTTVTATFSEPMDPTTVTLSTVLLRDSANAVVPATVAYNTSTRVATLTPANPLLSSAVYSATITTGVRDVSGNALGANQSWSFTIAAPPSCPCSVWDSSTTPSNPAVNDPNAVELGVKFRVDLNGFITGIRFYKGTTNTGTHVGNLWSSAGQPLATATFTSETASGWQQVNFPNPVAVTANTVYVASYHTTTGNYAANNGYFANAGVDHTPVHLLQDGVSGGNGIYAYSTSSTFPNNSFQSSNYWVDVVFTSTSGPTPLSVSSTTPASGVTGVALGTTVSATFNSALNPGTVNSSTFTLKNAGGTLLPASYSVSGNTATLTPTSALAASATYTATLTTGVRDNNGLALAANYTWSFTTSTNTLTTGPEPADWFSGDIHVHRSCGGPPEALSSLYNKMTPQNLAVISLLADSGNGEVQNPATDLPQVNGQDASVSTPGKIVHWDTEWHWDATYTQYPHQALGGHIVSLGLTQAQQIWQEYTYPILNSARQQGGIAGFAHLQYLDGNIPQSLSCCSPIEYPVEVALGAADFISEDVDDSGSSFSMNPEAFIQAYYKLLNTGFRPGFAAGTDYPCNSSRDLGLLLTYVQTAGGQLTYRNWIDGIARGRTVVSRNGHREFLDLKVNGSSTPGDEIRLAAAGSLPVTVQWTATQNFSGTIELVSNGVVVASQQASVAPGAPVTFSTTVNFPKSGWIAARRMDSDGHQVHTAAVFVIINNAPIRVSAADAQFYVQWMDNLLTKTSPGGPWNSFFPTQLSQAQARYQAAKAIFQQRATEATGPVPLGVTATTPASNATGVAPGTSLSAVFNNALDVTTINASTFILRDAGNAVVSATYGVNGNTATLTPGTPLTVSTTYTATLTTGVRDTNGTALAANYTWSFTTSSGGTGCTTNCTIWPSTAVPALIDQGPDGPVELGVKFRSDVSGTITGIRFYKAGANTGAHVGNLWSGTGQLLASATFSSETASGWQQVNFASPVSITANTDYVASYHANVGHYSQDANYFAATGVDNAPLHALQNSVSAPNGLYAYGTASAFPSQTFNSSNYWVDVVFSSGAAPTPVSIAVTPANPTIQAGATQQFTATGTYSGGSTQNITGQVTWTSSTTGTATINAGGLATALAAGTSSISATLGSVSGSTTLTVQSAPLTVTTASLSPGTAGTTYSATLTANGGVTPYTWSIIAGSLPSGLTLNAAAGTITGTPAVAGTSTFTVQAKDAAAATATKSLSITIAPPVVTTSFLAPTADAPVTSSAGDNNGFETTSTGAFASDGLFAVDANSGTNTNTGCTNTGKDKHLYFNYNVSLPAGATIKGIEVRLDAKVSSTANAPKMCVQLSWNGGTSWTAAKSTPTLTTTTATYILGAAADIWGHTPWTLAQFANSAFRVRIANVASSTARTFSLDGVAIRVTYQ